MHVEPNQSGGRDVTVKCSYLNLSLSFTPTACGDIRIIDVSGNEVGQGSVEVLTPEPPKPSPITDTQQAKADARRAICEPCDQNLGLSKFTVNCKGCGCARLSLLNGVCKLGKWEDESASGDGNQDRVG